MKNTSGMRKNVYSKSIKIMRICFASCLYLLSLVALAQSSVSENIVTESAPSTVSAGEVVTVQKSLPDKIIVNKAINPASPVISNSTGNNPQVGKHVRTNMNAGSMILSLLMVLVLIIICAFILKRFNFTQQGVSQLKVITSMSLGTKERVMVIQVGEEQLLLGVTAGQITLLDKLKEPLASQNINTANLPKNILSFLSAKKS